MHLCVVNVSIEYRLKQWDDRWDCHRRLEFMMGWDILRWWDWRASRLPPPALSPCRFRPQELVAQLHRRVAYTCDGLVALYTVDI